MATTVSKARTEEEITAGLMAMLKWAGNASAAARSLKAEQGIEISSGTLRDWVKEVHVVRYEELRDKFQEEIEQKLIQEFREHSGFALQVQRLALEKAEKALKAGEDKDPGRTAANAARVAQSNVDKMLSLSGRPTSIREDRNVEEILRSLARSGVIKVPDMVDAEVVEQPAIGA